MSLYIKHPFSDEQSELKEIEAKTRGKSKSNVNTENFEKCAFCGDPVFFNWNSCWNWACQDLAGNHKAERDRNIEKLWKGLNSHSPSFENMAFNSAEFNFKDKKILISKKDFRNCTFIGTHFSNIVFDHCTFENIDFTGSTFHNCSFNNVSFKKCDIFYAIFEQVRFTNSFLSELAMFFSFFECYFKKVEFKDVDFEECSLKGKLDKKCILSKTTFSNCTMSDLDLSLASIDNTVVIKRINSEKEESAKINNEEHTEKSNEKDARIDNKKNTKIEVLLSSLSPKSRYISHPFSGRRLKLEEEIEEIKEIEEKTKSNVSPTDIKKCPYCNAPVFFNWSFCWEHGIEKSYSNIDIGAIWEELKTYSHLSLENMSFNSAEFNFESGKYRLKDAVFHDCTFIGTYFSNIVFDHCVFENVNFTGTTFRKCFFKSAVFKNCDILYAKFEQTNFGNSLLSELALISSFFKCHFKKVEFKEVDCEKCFFNAKLDKRCKISRTTFSNCNLDNLDLSLASTDNTVTITGQDTKINSLFLNMAQRKNAITLRIRDDYYKIIKIKFLLMQNFRIKSIRYKVVDKIAMIFDCVAIAALISLLSYTIWSFIDDNISLVPFFRIAAYTFVVIFSLELYSYYHITKNDSKYFREILLPQNLLLQENEESYWGKYEKDLNAILVGRNTTV